MGKAYLEFCKKWPIEIVSLHERRYDDVANAITTVSLDAGDNAKLGYGTGDKFRTEIILSHIKNGATCIQVDLDVVIKRSVSMLLDLPYDFIISRAFAFPPIAFEQFGFVACTGFYIAKPGALSLCEQILGHIKNNTFNSHLDQFVLNIILMQAADKVSWRQRSVALPGVEFAMDEFDFQDCRIGVLPKSAILRNADMAASLFGNHDPSLLEQFLSPSIARTMSNCHRLARASYRRVTSRLLGRLS